MDRTETFKVLVADSNRNVREFVRREMLLAGYAAEMSGDARDILSRIRQDDLLDLLLLDPGMPLLDERALRHLLECRLPPLPVILYGYGEECPQDGILSLSSAFVERGGDVQELKDTVRRVLEARYPRRFSRWKAAAGTPQPPTNQGTGASSME